MSDIYLAKTVSEEDFHKPLVIKKLIPRYATKSSFVKRFVNEARTLARLNHSNIVQVMDMGITDGEYYIALEYIEGRNVAHIASKAVKTGRSPSLEFVLHVVLEIARGLAYSHRKKGESGESLMLVHQDVNSFNIMVSYEAEVKIIDFGIAQIFLDKKDTDILPVAGKLLYFSPEQLQRKPLDRRVDIYGTGVLMYELLAGERLVEHQETVGDTVKSILEMDIARKVGSNEKIVDELKPLLIKAMAFDPDDRYSWMEDMIQDIREVMKSCSLDIDVGELSVYMKEQFHREILPGQETDEENSPRKKTPMPRLQSVAAFAPEVQALPADRNDWSESALSLSSWAFGTGGESENKQANAPAKTLSFSAGQTIFRRGDPGMDLYVVSKGKVRLFF
jgi:serine/threonine protein kinase